MAKENDVPSIPQLNGDPHESRLQRLENEVSDLRVQHAEVSTNLVHLGGVVESAVTRISDKVDLCIKPLADTLQRHIEEDAVAKAKLSAVIETVSHLDALATQRANRWTNWKKGLTTLLLGAGAIGMKELVVVLFHAARHAP